MVWDGYWDKPDDEMGLATARPVVAVRVINVIIFMGYSLYIFISSVSWKLVTQRNGVGELEQAENRYMCLKCDLNIIKHT